MSEWLMVETSGIALTAAATAAAATAAHQAVYEAPDDGLLKAR